MKNIKKEGQIWIQFVIPFFIWVVILLLTKTELKINAESIKWFPEVITIYTIWNFIFNMFLWRLSFLQKWLVPFPDLNGSWKGELKSTWIDPKTKKNLPPIPMILVIKQTFNSISCVMYTAESTSYSLAASLSEDDDSGIKKLSYNYSNSPEATIRERSAIHNGAAVLTIVSKPNKKLKGEYWTDRKTSGSISLTFGTKEHLEEFTILATP